VDYLSFSSFCAQVNTHRLLLPHAFVCEHVQSSMVVNSKYLGTFVQVQSICMARASHATASSCVFASLIKHSNCTRVQQAHNQDMST
jgi:hypothetical protein